MDQSNWSSADGRRLIRRYNQLSSSNQYSISRSASNAFSDQNIERLPLFRIFQTSIINLCVLRKKCAAWLSLSWSNSIIITTWNASPFNVVSALTHRAVASQKHFRVGVLLTNRFIRSLNMIDWLTDWVIDWLGFNGTFSTNTSYIMTAKNYVATKKLKLARSWKCYVDKAQKEPITINNSLISSLYGKPIDTKYIMRV